jgi:hypothetical protein
MSKHKHRRATTEQKLGTLKEVHQGMFSCLHLQTRP